MFKKILYVVSVFGIFTIGNVFAASSFQNTCSNLNFIYQGSDAALSATCLREDGTPNASTLKLKGISNNNGALVQEGSGSSSFQKSCGNIQIMAKNPTDVVLTALCRTKDGTSKPASITLNGINNSNGNLNY